MFNFYPVTAVMLVLLALLVWGYALAWFFVNDVVKLLAYRIFDAEHSGILSKAGAPQKPA